MKSELKPIYTRSRVLYVGENEVEVGIAIDAETGVVFIATFEASISAERAISTPAERTYYVPEEDRSVLIEYENRTVTIY